MTFGPDESFVAWDSTSIRWSKIPDSLEELFQEWLSPGGWLYGPPRLVALGREGSFVAISQHGGWGYRNLPGDMKTEIEELKLDLSELKVSGESTSKRT